MKFLILNILFLFSITLYAQTGENQVVEQEEEFSLSDHCRFEGKKWRGQRRIAGTCLENREVNVGCIAAANSETPAQNRMQTCECLMRNVDFYQKSREAFNFKMMRSQEAIDFNKEKGFIAKKEKTQQMYKDLCFPSKALEIVGSCKGGICDRYYAIYMYQENNSGTDPKCTLIRTSHNWPHVFQQKFFFPGAINVTKLFQRQLDLNVTVEGYKGSFNHDNFNRSDSIDGDLNCYGSYSQVNEEAQREALIELEQGSVINESRELAGQNQQDDPSDLTDEKESSDSGLSGSSSN